MRTTVLALVSLLTAASATAAQPDLARAATARLGQSTAITVFDLVSARASDGVVTLEGRVTTSWKRESVETQVASLPGVRQVVNNVRVLPSSSTDDDLRYRISKALFAHPAFREYAAMAQPPLRVLVERGRVTLAGSVASAVEKTLAVSLASVPGAVSVEDELKIQPG